MCVYIYVYIYMKVKVLVTQLCLTLCNPMDCRLPGSSVHGIPQARILGVGCHSLLQGIFPTQGLNPSLLHCRQILYSLSHQVAIDIYTYIWAYIGFPDGYIVKLTLSLHSFRAGFA